MSLKLSLRWKIIAIYACVMVSGVAIAAQVIQQRYQTTFIEQKLHELEMQQAQIIKDLPLYVAQQQFQPVNGVETLIIDQAKNVLSQSSFPEQRLFNELTQIANSQQQKKLQYHYEIGEQLMNVQITKISEPEEIFVISYVLAGVPSFLSNVLLQEVVILFSALFICGSAIFLIWTLYLAKDLKRIHQFAQQIGARNWQARLDVKRHDEIGEVALKLQAVQQQLALAEQQQIRFFHHTSHDLKTPIAVIQGYTEAIADGIYPQGTLAASVAIINEEAKVLNRKVEQLLSYAKMQQVETEDQQSNVSAIVEAYIKKVQPLQSQISFEVELDQGVLWPGTQWEWEQVLDNLIDNALRYAMTTIHIQVDDEQVMIHNDGPKLTQAERQRIFQPFATGSGGKYGLGLAICHEFAQRYVIDFQALNTPTGVSFRFLRIEADKITGDDRSEMKNYSKN
ncbi:MAG: ATP-binding protein [Culicoidibacterales bacterium]